MRYVERSKADTFKQHSSLYMTFMFKDSITSYQLKHIEDYDDSKKTLLLSNGERLTWINRYVNLNTIEGSKELEAVLIRDKQEDELCQLETT
jgi:hypothetical protein